MMVPREPRSLLFCGSSSIAQFGNAGSLRAGTFFFSGARLAGLSDWDAGSGPVPILRHLARLPGEKAMLLMFGAMDVDFELYRAALLDPALDQAAYFAACVAAYRVLLPRLLDEAPGMQVFVLAPQPSALRDDIFPDVTARIAKVPQRDLETLGLRFDLSHHARLDRTQAFNTLLECAVPSDPRIRVVRIDLQMRAPDGSLSERFFPHNPRDHHARAGETLKLWRSTLAESVEEFVRFRAQPAASA